MITNAKDRPINEPVLLGMDSALRGLYRNIKYFAVEKKVQDFLVTETLTGVNFRGVIQPLKPAALMMKPEGQRGWKWFTIHAGIGVVFKNDDVIYIGNIRYRIMELFDWSIYGFVEYHMVQDYQDRSNSPPIADATFQKYIQDLVFTSPLVRSIDVSGTIDDANAAIWQLFDSDNEEQIGAIQVLSSTTIQVTVSQAGTYRAIGGF